MFKYKPNQQVVKLSIHTEGCLLGNFITSCTGCIACCSICKDILLLVSPFWRSTSFTSLRQYSYDARTIC